MRKRVIKTAGFLLLAAFANPLTADSSTDYSSGWYIGGNIGMSTANIDEEKITQGLINPLYTDDESDLGYKLFGGYQFNENFALEGGYFDLGQFGYALSAFGGTKSGSIKVMGVNLDAVGILPITEDFSAFARVGATYAQAKDSFSGTLPTTDIDAKKSDLNYKFGAGLQYAITEAVGVRLEAERYRINDAVGNNGDVNLVSIGLTYRFGATRKDAPAKEEEERVAPIEEEKEAAAAVEEEKEAAAAVVVEEEVLVVVTEPNAQQKIKESITQKKRVTLVFEDIHFEFDKSTLSKETKDALKKDIAQLDKNPNIKMQVAGYTSEMGTEKYNQGLSERRAESVKDYLLKEKLFAADKISVIGYGDTRPAQYEAKPGNINSKAAKANMRVLLKIIHE